MYIVSTIIFVAGLVLSWIILRKFRQAYKLPFVGSIGMIVFAIGLMIDTFVSRHLVNKTVVPSWLYGGLEAAGLILVVIAVLAISFIFYRFFNAKEEKSPNKAKKHYRRSGPSEESASQVVDGKLVNS